jgi:hypothetical protein
MSASQLGEEWSLEMYILHLEDSVGSSKAKKPRVMMPRGSGLAYSELIFLIHKWLRLNKFDSGCVSNL